MKINFSPQSRAISIQIGFFQSFPIKQNTTKQKLKNLPLVDLSGSVTVVNPLLRNSAWTLSHLGSSACVTPHNTIKYTIIIPCIHRILVKISVLLLITAIASWLTRYVCVQLYIWGVYLKSIPVLSFY